MIGISAGSMTGYKPPKNPVIPRTGPAPVPAWKAPPTAAAKARTKKPLQTTSGKKAVASAPKVKPLIPPTPEQIAAAQGAASDASVSGGNVNMSGQTVTGTDGGTGPAAGAGQAPAAAAPAATTMSPEEKEAADLERLGPKWNVEAATYDTEAYGAAQGYDVGDRYRVSDFGAAKGYDTGKGYGAAGFGDQTNIRDVGYGSQERVSPQSMSAMNFNPYRRAAMQDVDQTSARNLSSAEDALSRTGGLSGADRMALASQSNRQKIEGRQGARNQADMMEMQNRYQTQQQNVGAINRGQEVNAAEANRRSADMYGFDTGRARTDAAEANQRGRITQGQETGAGRDLWRAETDQSKYLSDVENERSNIQQQQATQSSKDLWGANIAERSTLAAEKNKRSAATTSDKNKRARDIALLKYGADSDQYKAAVGRHRLGKQLDYGESIAGQPEPKEGSGGFLGNPSKEIGNWWESAKGWSF